MRHIPGLDTIRLVCALIVALGHFAPNLAQDLSSMGCLAVRAGSAVGLMFNGPAAVIVFFVLSGYVIHRPYSRGKPFQLGEYFARRYFRIVPPLLAAGMLYLAVHAGPADEDWNNTVMWSVFCELVYYTLYPLIRLCRVPIAPLALASYGLSFGLVLAFPDVARRIDGNYVAFGHWTFVIGLPCWLSGCWLASRDDASGSVSVLEILGWRAAVYFGAVAALIVKFHLPWLWPLSVYSFSLNLLAPVATLWIGREVAYWSGRAASRPDPVTDRWGRASFSLYLIHPVALMTTHRLTGEHGIAATALFVSLTAAMTAAFYFIAEKPSHRLAQHVGRRVGRARMGV